MRAYFRISVLGLLTSLALFACSPQLGFAGPVPATQTGASAKGKSSGKSQPTDQEIGNAKTHDLVWVNTATRVYHKSVSPLYGKTERGKFMSEDDAKRAGYRIADESRSQRALQGNKTDKH